MRKKVIIVAILVTVAVAAFWFFQPAHRYDVGLVHPRLRALQQPYRSVKTAYYMDGGSIGIEIIDRDGHREQFAIPSHLGDTNRYTRIFVGAMRDHKPEAVEIFEPEHTKRMLVCILQDYPNRTAWDDFSLMALRRRPVDFARCLIHRWRGDYKP
jgi:hypothetical protein